MSRVSWHARACGLLLIGAAASAAAGAQTFRTLANFDGTNGEQPLAPLVQGTNGNLYGTTNQGGALGLGTILKMTPGGSLTTLYSFCSQSDCADGANPYGGLALGKDGNLYGTTLDGGMFQEGTVFRVSPGGTLTTLYSFCAVDGCPDGAMAEAGLTLGTDGNFYGTTAYGGTSIFCSDGCGTVFRITPAGALTTLYNFCPLSGCADGSGPRASLALGADGNFYGTTFSGGSATTNAGTVFRLTPGGTLTTVYTFCGQSPCTDGEQPWGGLVQARDENFYGTTYNGGTYGEGTVFKISPAGTVTLLYSFCPQAGCLDGSNPRAGLALGTDGNFYGATELNGSGSVGTVFKITRAGTLTTLHSFESTDGGYPEAAPFQATNGAFYGTTGGGGPEGDGTIFSLAVGLHPFVQTVPAAGEVGQRVLILGTNLTGATSVTFNGTAATFTVSSRSLITATVPAGATTGTVQVVTPGGALSSNVPFRVVQ